MVHAIITSKDLVKNPFLLLLYLWGDDPLKLFGG